MTLPSWAFFVGQMGLFGRMLAQELVVVLPRLLELQRAFEGFPLRPLLLDRTASKEELATNT